MAVDAILALIALATAVVGTLTTPPKWVKGLIIGMAALACLASLVKTRMDETDKQFVRTALIFSLHPSFGQEEALSDWARMAMAQDDCPTLKEIRVKSGLALLCYDFIFEKNNKREPTRADTPKKAVALTNTDLSNMLANDLTSSHWTSFPSFYRIFPGVRRAPNPNVEYVRKVADRDYDDDDDDQPARLEEEIGVIGEAMVKFVTGGSPDGFQPDANNGVEVTYQYGGQQHRISVSRQTVDDVPNRREAVLIGHFADVLRGELVSVVQDPNTIKGIITAK